MRPDSMSHRAESLGSQREFGTWAYRLLVDAGFTPHVRRRREEIVRRTHGRRARRWAVERTHGWMNRFRGLHVRW
jgi:transposase